MSEHEDETLAPDPDPDPEEEEGTEEEEADQDDQPEPSPQPEPEAVSASFSPEEREKRYKKIATSFTTYTNAVEKNLEEEALQLMPCALCSSTAHPGFVNKGFAGRVPDDIAANVKLYLGFAQEQEYAQDPGTNTCQVCEGKTKVKTGAVAGEYIVRTCPNCKGYGFMPPPGSDVSAPATNGAATPLPLAAPSDFDTGDVDSWGEPKVLPDGSLNTNFGKMPQFKTPHPTYGVTAGLTALHAVE